MPRRPRVAAAVVLMTVGLTAAATGAWANPGPGAPTAGGPAGARAVAVSDMSATLPLDPGPGLMITVLANGEPAGAAPGPSIEVGAAVVWAYDVTNDGAGNLWSLYLWHEGVGAADCPDRSLSPGKTVRCTAASTAVPGTFARGVSAWAWDDAGAQATAAATACYTGIVSPVAPQPAIDLETFVAGDDADVPPGPVVVPGQAVAFRYRVRNVGNVTLWGLRVHDEVLGTITCPKRSLAPGERVVCPARRTARPGPFAAAAEARAWDAAGTQVVDRDLHHYLGATGDPAVEIEALVEGFDGDRPPGPRVGRPGETILFTYLVTNTGGTPLTRVRVKDRALGAVECPGTTLAIGETMTCNATTVARLGRFASVGRVSARAGTQVVRDSDPVHYHVRHEPRIHHLAVEVGVNGRDADDAASAPNIPVGNSARFTYVIAYTGNNFVYNVTIQDPRIPESLISCNGDRTLAARETLRCTATVRAVAGPYASLVTVVSWDADGTRVTAEDWVHYYGMA